MKILILQETDWIGRNPAQQHHLAEMMSMRGHQVKVIDFPLSWRSDGHKGLYSKRKVFNKVNKIHEEANIQLIRPGFIRLTWLDFLSIMISHKIEIDREFNNDKPDIVIGFGIINSYLALRVGQRHKTPFIYYWIDVLHLLIPIKIFQSTGAWIEKKSLKKSDRILTINDKLRDLVIKMGASADKTIVLRAGIDANMFNPSIERQPIRKQLGIESDDIVLFFMGFLYNFSGLKEVAIRLTQIKDNRFKLVIVGEGDAYSEIELIRKNYNLQNRIILTGKKSYHEIPGLISAADICLLPSYPWEPIMQDIVPIKLYEYMAMKKPVICTKLPGVMREFGEGNGIIYVDQPQDVVEKAMELTAKNNLIDFGTRAREFVERISWTRITDEFEKILTDAIKENNK